MKIVESEKHTALKGAFSVEAAWVFGITMLLIYSIIAFSFKLYSSAIDFIENTSEDKWEAVQAFRLLQAGEDILKGLK